MRTLVFIFIFLSTHVCWPQLSSDKVEELGVEIKDRMEGNDALYTALKGYKAVLIGEMHGTKEPPEFLVGIARSLMKNGKKFVVALELPSDGIDFTKTFSLEELKKHPAFYGMSPDGRQSIAWADMLIELQKMKAEIICFDLGMHYKGDIRLEHDSMLYENINEYLKKDTSRMLVALSGNISNMMGKYNKYKTMAYYMIHEKHSILKGKSILSLNHAYGKGTMYNWMNDGYKLRETEGNAPFYEYASTWDSYLFVMADPFMKGYGGVLFSKTITASDPLVETK